MAKSGSRIRRRRVKASHAASRSTGPNRRRDRPVQLVTRNDRSLLDRLLDAPHLAHIVPRLQPEVLHRVIQTYGLEDCAAFVALATPDQLARVFDLDLWRAREPGLDEELDANRFGLWLEVLMESGAPLAAQKLLGVDVDLVVAGLAQHLFVFDLAAAAPPASADGDEPIDRPARRDGIVSEIGGYLIEARRPASWDTIVDLLVFLDAEHPDYFHRVMGGCRRVSNSLPEADGLHDLMTDAEQGLFDLAIGRERRREQQGYVTPPQARAFLQMARHVPLGHDAPPPGNPVARSYFQAIDAAVPADLATHRESARLLLPSGPAAALPDDDDVLARLDDVLREAGILAEQPRALLEGPGGGAPRLERIQTHLQYARDCDQAAYLTRTEELAYLANTIVAGCSIQARPFTALEASDAAAAICNLGLDNWPRQWLPDTSVLPDAFLVDHDLVSVFQVGWTVLHHDVCMYVARRLIEIVTDLTCGDAGIQAGLVALRRDLARQCDEATPWRARDALDVLAVLDMPAWATVLGLIDECPVIHGGLHASPGSGIRAVSASAFEFISDNRQIASVQEFMRRLPATLGGII